MATTTVLVTQLTGQAWVRGKNGALIPIRQGIAMPVGLRIVTAPNSTIQLQVEGMPPLTLCENTDITLTEDLFAPVDFSEAGTDADLNALFQELAQESASAAPAVVTPQPVAPAPIPDAPSASVAQAPAIPALETEEILSPSEPPAPELGKRLPEPVELSMADAIAPLEVPLQEDSVPSSPAVVEEPLAHAANDASAEVAAVTDEDPALSGWEATSDFFTEANVETDRGAAIEIEPVQDQTPQTQLLQDDAAFELATDAAFAPNEPMDALQTMQALEAAAAAEAAEAAAAASEATAAQQPAEQDLAVAWASDAAQKPVAEAIPDDDVGLSPELMEALQQVEAADEQASAAMQPAETLQAIDDSDTVVTPDVMDAVVVEQKPPVMTALADEPIDWDGASLDPTDSTPNEAAPAAADDLDALQMASDMAEPSVDESSLEPADSMVASASATDEVQERCTESCAIGADDTVELIDAEGNTLTPVDMAEVPDDMSPKAWTTTDDEATALSSEDIETAGSEVGRGDEAMDLNLDLMIPANPATPMALVESEESTSVMLANHVSSTTDVEPMTAERVDSDDTQENQKSQVKVSGGGLVTEGTDIEFIVTLADGSAQDLVVSLKISANRPK